jgi:hypothetical protein
MKDQVFKKPDDSQRLYGLEFMLADVDDQSGYPHYYGYVAWNGSFYIMKENKTGSITYAKYEFGARARYSQAWVNRAGLTYTPWDTTF